MKKYIILILTFTPLFSFAEGQYGLGVFLDTIDFIKVFSVWAIMIFILIRILNYVCSTKLKKLHKKYIWLGTGLIALFFWSMIKHDPYPYEGPIDSIFKTIPTYDENQEYSDGVTVYVYDSSIDSDSIGVYVWKKGVKMFVRKLTDKEKKHEEINEALTREVIDSWDK